MNKKKNQLAIKYLKDGNKIENKKNYYSPKIEKIGSIQGYTLGDKSKPPTDGLATFGAS